MPRGTLKHQILVFWSWVLWQIATKFTNNPSMSLKKFSQGATDLTVEFSVFFWLAAVSMVVALLAHV